MDREGGSMEKSSCHYSVLGVRKDASLYDIRAAYRKLALEWHPDRWVKKPSQAGEANHRFQKIHEAYSVLSDQGKRSMYDAGVLDLLDDDDEGMGDFLHDLMSMMEKNVGSEQQQESLEDLQKTFVEMFAEDLASYLRGQEQDQGSSKKRARVRMPCNQEVTKGSPTSNGPSCM